MSNAFLQVWICASPVLATLLLAPMLVCAKPGAWLPAPVAAIVRAATPAQVARFRASQPETSVSVPRLARRFPRAESVPVGRSCNVGIASLPAITLCLSAPRAP